MSDSEINIADNKTIPLSQIISSEAREWLGTPFKHQGRKKQIGCDCIGLIIGIFTELNLSIKGTEISKLDQNNYPRVPQGNMLQNRLDEIFPESESLSQGDIILMRFTNNPQHVAIISDIKLDNTQPDKKHISIIHAYQQNEGVVEHNLSHNWRKRIVKIYNPINSLTNRQNNT